jgi:hypothetical protein
MVVGRVGGPRVPHEFDADRYGSIRGSIPDAEAAAVEKGAAGLPIPKAKKHGLAAQRNLREALKFGVIGAGGVAAFAVSALPAVTAIAAGAAVVGLFLAAKDGADAAVHGVKALFQKG